MIALIAGATSPAFAQDPSSSEQIPESAAGVTEGSVIIVTAQKREESIQDVPIAVTALSSEDLDAQKIEGGSELLRAVPNVSFSKSNFSMYNFSIRGIGTKAISAASDPAVAISFNNTPLVRNRLFESEFFDMARIEVLRGPQGTLYGRNATAGVVNLIPALPTDEFEGSVKAEVGSYSTRRLNGMLNVPLGDTFGVRVAGQWTKRDGFDYNTFTQNRVNGRDLWSTRAIAEWEPSDRFRANVIWQHFEEDDNRSRTGKQLCTRDPGPTMVGTTPVPADLQGRLSQGCLPRSLYDEAAFGAPNASGLAFLVAGNIAIPMGVRPDTFEMVYGMRAGDPFADVAQSRDLREIATSYDPVFRAKNDVFQGNLEFDISDSLRLVSQTAYARDRYYSSQDYNRFLSAPIFNDTTGLVSPLTGEPIDQAHAAPGAIFVDPQLGASDRLLAVDLNRSRNSQWSQEFRLQSSFDGPINFNIGANYLHFKSQDDYFVFNNTFSFIAYNLYNRPVQTYPNYHPCPPDTVGVDCVYVDPNPIGSLDELGHNYFLSRNVVKTESWAIFGEAYWNVAENVKLTAGLRFTKDSKTATPIPSQLLLGGGGELGTSGGSVSAGYPADPEVKQRWSEPTGRLVLDWMPDLSFTDDTLIYASASRGYKGGGTNPPRPNLNPRIVQFQPLPATFEPEYVNAFEIGTKNTFAGGRFTLNATGFYYDYEGYQVSKIVDRISLNENFDATIWGLELEAAWRPSRAFQMDANLGYLRTRLKDGSQSIDVMNRTQGNEDWVLLRPWIQIPSNCIAPRQHVETILNSPLAPFLGLNALGALCGGSKETGTFNPEVDGLRMDQFFGFTYNPLTDAPNGGRGFFADLSGNELPNAPRLTFNVGAQYTVPIDGGDWELTLRGDYYRQSKSFARVYNTEFDRLKGWDNANILIALERPASGLEFQLYVKNVFDKTPITDFFVNSDDTGLTSNIFTLDPRIIGFSVSKSF
ncbi:TonB-dependent receptor [Pelagerythrobacter aerophilus]|uniref:TonB-dependent receptor n=1 Tax=Pelagerythrobacter aerophilus TaxID=2306995 RepID=A0A418NIM3_9SPHN|nr:TonB-dependent receptor [Pelagerythrobacter aerophilus]RIV79187.1 TonB-dependent receptor [Pelagerythrobacter aerophilus]